MGRPRRDTLPILVRAPRHLMNEVERIARQKRVSRQTVVLDALTLQLEVEPPNVFDKSPPVAAE